jgi:hypothetical protein
MVYVDMSHKTLMIILCLICPCTRLIIAFKMFFVKVSKNDHKMI